MQGPNVGQRLQRRHRRLDRFRDGALTTGDAALMLDGELYVLGRIGDSVKVRGRTVFVEDVEAKVFPVDGIRKAQGGRAAGATARATRWPRSSREAAATGSTTSRRSSRPRPAATPGS